MNISDKKFVEFSEQIWERNKELLAEVKRLKELSENRSGVIERLENENRALRRDLEEVNARYNDVMDKQYERIRTLEDENERLKDGLLSVQRQLDIFADWDDLIGDCEDDLESSECYENCTFNIYVG